MEEIELLVTNKNELEYRAKLDLVVKIGNIGLPLLLCKVQNQYFLNGYIRCKYNFFHRNLDGKKSSLWSW